MKLGDVMRKKSGAGSFLSARIKAVKKKRDSFMDSVVPGSSTKSETPGFVPIGLDSSLFSFGAKSSDAGQIIRRNVLDNSAPGLNQAIASGDIFAYNAAIKNLRTMVSRTTGGPALPEEMPDPEELRRRSRLRRRPTGSRTQTLGLSY